MTTNLGKKIYELISESLYPIGYRNLGQGRLSQTLQQKIYEKTIPQKTENEIVIELPSGNFTDNIRQDYNYRRPLRTRSRLRDYNGPMCLNF
jgi:hypothetical protein